MKDYRETKRKLLEVSGTLTTAVQLLRQGTEADKETVDFVIACSARLEKIRDFIKVSMPKFSEYRRSGKVWHSTPFYYEGYKMCLAVYANGVGEGAGTHVSVTLMLLKREHDSTQHQSEPRKCTAIMHKVPAYMCFEGQQWFMVCRYQPLSQYSEAVKELSDDETFCTHKFVVSKLVNDCLTFSIKYCDECFLEIGVN
jgi:hypothetical protein